MTRFSWNLALCALLTAPVASANVLQLRQDVAANLSSTSAAINSTSATSSTTSSQSAPLPSQTPGFVNNGTVGTYTCAQVSNSSASSSSAGAGSAGQLAFSPDSVPGSECRDAQPPVYPYNAIRLRAPDDSIRATFLPYGASVSELWVKDRFGGWRDVVLGFDNKTNYGTDPIHPNFGPVVGRYANRIKNGTFSVDGTEYHTPLNENNVSTLHGGTVGYDRSSFTITALTDNHVELLYMDPDGAQGFPGAVNATAKYTLANNATWQLSYTATASARTPIMLSSHTYWNLEAYNETQSVLDHVLHLPKANKYVATDSTLIPTGDMPVVEGTPYDFRNATPFSDLFNQTQGVCGADCQGWDSCWVMDDHERDEPVIELYSPHSGIKLSVTSDQPAIQVYTCDGISSAKGSLPRKQAHGGTSSLTEIYENHSCVVLEMESAIDAINQPQWGIDQIYGPDRPYEWNSEYVFSTVAEDGSVFPPAPASASSNSTSGTSSPTPVTGPSSSGAATPSHASLATSLVTILLGPSSAA